MSLLEIVKLYLLSGCVAVIARCTITWMLVGILGHWWRVLNKKADFYPCLQSLWYQTRSRAGHLAAAYGWRVHPSPCVWFHTTFLAPYIWSVHTVHNLLVCSARFVVRILLACVVSWRCLWHNKCTRVTYGKPWVHNASAALSVSLCHFSFHLQSLYVVIEDCQNPMSQEWHPGQQWWCRGAENRGAQYACAILSWSIYART